MPPRASNWANREHTHTSQSCCSQPPGPSPSPPPSLSPPPPPLHSRYRCWTPHYRGKWTVWEMCAIRKCVRTATYATRTKTQEARPGKSWHWSRCKSTFIKSAYVFAAHAYLSELLLSAFATSTSAFTSTFSSSSSLSLSLVLSLSDSEEDSLKERGVGMGGKPHKCLHGRGLPEASRDIRPTEAQIRTPTRKQKACIGMHMTAYLSELLLAALAFSSSFSSSSSLSLSLLLSLSEEDSLHQWGRHRQDSVSACRSFGPLPERSSSKPFPKTKMTESEPTDRKTAPIISTPNINICIRYHTSQSCCWRPWPSPPPHRFRCHCSRSPRKTR